jgi:hypothetical protein
VETIGIQWYSVYSVEIVVCGWIFQWIPAKSSGKHREHRLAKLLAFGQRGKRTEWQPPDSTDIMVFGSGSRHQPMPPSADEPVATSAFITVGNDHRW